MEKSYTKCLIWYSICSFFFFFFELANILSVCVVFMFLHMSVRLEAVKQLSVETESEGSVLLRWSGVSGARAYRLVWGPFTGQDKSRRRQTHRSSFPSALTFSLQICTIVYLFCYFSVQRSECGDCGGCRWQWVSHFVPSAARHRVHRHYHPAVWGQHRGTCSHCQVQNR